jgi:hypothetical protein
MVLLTAACWAAAEGCAYVGNLTLNDVPPLHAFVPKPRIPTDIAAMSPAACLGFQMERLGTQLHKM